LVIAFIGAMIIHIRNIANKVNSEMAPLLTKFWVHRILVPKYNLQIAHWTLCLNFKE